MNYSTLEELRAIITEGPDAGTSELYRIIQSQEGRAYLVTHAYLLQEATLDDLDVSPQSGPHAGQTAFSWLANTQDGADILTNSGLLVKMPLRLQAIFQAFQGMNHGIKCPVLACIDAYIERHALQVNQLSQMIKAYQYVDAIELLTTHEFSAQLIDLLPETDNPLWQAVVAYVISVKGAPREHLALIELLREKKFKLYFTELASEHGQPNDQVFQCALLLRDCFTPKGDANERFKRQIRQTRLWSKTPTSYEHYTKAYSSDMFYGDLLGIDEIKFNRLANYFSQVSSLFADQSACIDLLKEIEAQLAASIPWLGEASYYPDSYILSERGDWPLPGTSYTHRSKSKLLIRIIAGILQGDGEDARINLLPQHDFLHTLSYIDPLVVKELFSNGELFIEKAYLPGMNVHGYLSHPLQWTLLVLAHKQGKLILPDDFTFRELLHAAVSEEIKVDGGNVWNRIFDNALLNNFSDPSTLHVTLIGNRGVSVCPHLSAYLRDHYWHCYQQVANKINTSIEALLIFDELVVGNFILESPTVLNMEYLIEKYQRKQIEVIYHSLQNTIYYLNKIYRKRASSQLSEPVSSMSTANFSLTIEEMECLLASKSSKLGGAVYMDAAKKYASELRQFFVHHGDPRLLECTASASEKERAALLCEKIVQYMIQAAEKNCTEATELLMRELAKNPDDLSILAVNPDFCMMDTAGRRVRFGLLDTQIQRLKNWRSPVSSQALARKQNGFFSNHPFSNYPMNIIDQTDDCTYIMKVHMNKLLRVSQYGHEAVNYEALFYKFETNTIQVFPLTPSEIEAFNESIQKITMKPG